MRISLDDQLLTLSQAAKLLPGKPHVSTLWRWVQHGCRGIKLESLVLAGRRFTSREALDRFAAATTAAANGSVAPLRTAKQRQRDIRRAEQELRDAGIC